MSDNLNKESHSLLPADAILILKKAQQTPIPEWDPLARVKAIDLANQKVRLMYPSYFLE